MSPMCRFDSNIEASVSFFQPYSDCYESCQSFFHCVNEASYLIPCKLESVLGNGICEEQYATRECGLDGGDCGFCALGCRLHTGFEADLANGVCKSECDLEVCEFDGGDCVSTRQGFCASGCFQDMLGNNVCDAACLTSACDNDLGDCEDLCHPDCFPYMVGDGECDRACYVVECSWDESDCDCAPGCTPALLANEICDSPCSSRLCAFDNGHCVLVPQGNCAVGCFNDMLGDGVCDIACKTESCAWDGLDCGCAPGCDFSDLGSCKPACMVVECGYDSTPLTESSCLLGIDALQCEQAQCWVSVYDFQKCFHVAECCGSQVEVLVDCFDSCSVRGYGTSERHPNLCVKEVKPSSESSPHTIYVNAAYEGAQQDGSLEKPFLSLAQAFRQVRAYYVCILLFPGVYVLEAGGRLVIDPALQLGSIPDSILKFKQVSIDSYSCRRTDHCSRVTILRNTQPQAYFSVEQSRLEVANADFRFALGDETCPECDTSWRVFLLSEASLRLRNVTFSHFVDAMYSLITASNAHIELVNVDLLGITLKDYYSVQTGLIASSDYLNMTYRGGTVSLLNSNFTYFSKITTSGLLCLEAADLLIESVTIEFSIVDSVNEESFQTCHGLLSVRACFHCSIRDSTFRNNLAFAGTVLAYALKPLDETDALRLQRFVVSNCSFANNTSSAGGVLVFTRTQEVSVENCSFLDNLSAESGVLVVDSASALQMHGVHFRNCRVGRFGVIAVRNVSTVSMQSVSLRHCGSIGSDNVNETTLFAFARAISYPLSIASFPCTSLVNLTLINSTELTDFRLESQMCQLGLFVSQHRLSVIDTVLTRNSGANQYGGVLWAKAKTVTFRGLECTDNNNTHLQALGTVFLECTECVLQNCTFARNQAYSGGAVYFSKASLISVNDSLFEGNSADSGGAAFLDLPSNVSFVSVTHARFTLNSATTAGGVLAIRSGENQSAASLQISDSTFAFNACFFVSVVLLQYVSLAASSLVERTSYMNNSAVFGGVLGVYQTAGHLSIVDSEFYENRGGDGSALYFQCRSSACSLALHRVMIARNTGQFIVSVTGSELTAEQVRCVENHGSCIELEFASLEATECEFLRNRAISGAGLHLVTTRARVSKSVFHSNAVTYRGGATFSEVNSTLTCSDCCFLNNTSRWQGGALFVQQSALHLSRSQITANTAFDSGFAVFLFESEGVSSVDLCEFSENAGEGYATISLISAVLAVSSSRLRLNKSLRLTGGVMLHLSVLTVEGSRFEQQSSTSGSFLYVYHSSLSVRDSILSEGTAASSGGGVLAISSSLNFMSTTFQQLESSLGAVLYAQSASNITFTSCVFTRILSPTITGILCISDSALAVFSSSFANYTESAIFATQSSLLVNGSSFEMANATFGGAVYCSLCAPVFISFSRFSDLHAQSGGALYLSMSTDSASRWAITHSEFGHNIASDGGAVMVQGASVDLLDCRFVDNRAAGKAGRGGALLLMDAAGVLKNSTFEGNWAGQKGGAVCWEGCQPQIEGSRFESNTAVYGPDLASQAVTLSLQSPNVVLGVASGQRIQHTIALLLLDNYGQEVLTDNESFAVLTSPDPSTSFTGLFRVQAAQGRFEFRDFAVVSAPGRNASVFVTSTAVLGVSVSLTFQMRDCVLGEMLTHQQCLVCEAGTYSLDATQSCRECPEAADCYGNFTITPKQGYWRTHMLSDKFFVCPNPTACLGSPAGVHLTGQCAEGYFGNMCQSCEPGYFRWESIYCSQCPPLRETVAIQTGISLLIAALLALLIMRVFKPESESWVRIRVFLNYAQVVMLFSAINVGWPTMILDLMNALQTIGAFPEFILKVECFLQLLGEEETYYFKLIVLAFVQPALVLISSSIWTVVLFFTPWKRVKSRLISSAVVLYFLTYTSALRVLLGVFRCEEINDSEYWVKGTAARCWTQKHLKYAIALALPCILLWGVLGPALTLLLAVKWRKTLESPDYRLSFAFLVQGYHAFAWEFLTLAKKLVITCCVVFGSQVTAAFSAVSALSVLLLSLAAQHAVQPFSTPSLNSLEVKSLLIAITTLYLGLVSSSHVLDAHSRIVVFAIVAALNLYFAVACFGVALSGVCKAVIRSVRRGNQARVQDLGIVESSQSSQQAMVQE